MVKQGYSYFLSVTSSRISVFISQARVVLKLFVLLIGRLIACRISVKRETDKPSTITLTSNACCVLKSMNCHVNDFLSRASKGKTAKRLVFSTNQKPSHLWR